MIPDKTMLPAGGKVALHPKVTPDAATVTGGHLQPTVASACSLRSLTLSRDMMVHGDGWQHPWLLSLQRAEHRYERCRPAVKPMDPCGQSWPNVYKNRRRTKDEDRKPDIAVGHPESAAIGRKRVGRNGVVHDQRGNAIKPNGHNRFDRQGLGDVDAAVNCAGGACDGRGTVRARACSPDIRRNRPVVRICPSARIRG